MSTAQTDLAPRAHRTLCSGWAEDRIGRWIDSLVLGAVRGVGLRRHRDTRWRTDGVGNFPNREAVIRLVSAVLT